MKILELKQKVNKLLPFCLSLVKDKKRFRIVYFSLIVLSTLTLLSGFEWSIYLVWWLLGFGWSLFFFRKSINLLEHFLLGGAVFTSLFLVFISLFAIVNIPINIFFFILFVIISLFVFIYQDVFQYVNFKISDYDYLVLLLFIFALVGKVFPLRNYFAAPLHDPISHSMMAKDIVDTGLIEYFYSPGLHIVAAFGELLKGFNVAKQVLLLSGFYSAYSGIVIYVFLKKFFKDKVWALIVAMLFSVGYYPSMLTIGAGKNTLIMALPILFFIMFVTTQYLQSKNWRTLLMVIFSLTALFLIHYPTAVLGSLFLGVIFLVYFKDFKWKGLLAILGILFGLGWAGRSYQYQVLLKDSLANPERTSIGYQGNGGDILESITYYLNALRAYINTNLKDWNRYPTILSLLAIPVLLIQSFSKKQKKSLLLSLWILLSFLFYFLISAIQMSELTILIESHFLSLAIFIYILCGYILTKTYKFLTDYFLDIKKWSYILIGLFLATITILSYMTYRRNKEFMINANYVYEEDVNVFNWIDKNLDEDEGILITAYDTYEVVFSADAGGYIEVFTGNPISTPFYEYDRKSTHDNLEYYKQLQTDFTNCQYRENLIDLGYQYYFQGSHSFPGSVLPLIDREIDPNNLSGFEVLVEDDEAILFKMLGCQ